MTAPQPAEITTPVSNNRVTDQLPNLLAMPNTRKIENTAPAKAAFDSQKPVAPNSMADSAPTAAPPDMPRIYGSARGLRSNTCMIAPDSASSPPVTNAARVRGIRISCKTCVLRLGSVEVRLATTCAMLMSTLPLRRENSMLATAKTVRQVSSSICL